MRTRLVALATVLVFAVAVFALVQWQFARPGSPEPIACTMEALLCPDGSSVGRSGPQCTFTACPAVPSVVGVLEQTTDGFRMVFDSPVADTQGVAYAMPVQVNVTNALKDLVGRRVRASGVFTEGNVLAADNLEALPGDASDPTLGAVAVGRSVFVNGVRITLHGVVQDSRCPVDAMCIEAGAIVANVTLRSDTDAVTRNMPSDEVPLAFDSYRVSIESVSPALYSGRSIRPDEYVVTFKVVAN